MDIFNILTLIGGISLFLFGMNIMGQALERRAGSKLRGLLKKITTNKFVGLFTGLAITAVIQSSGATTVMVVGFVNSGLMTLRQAINVIIGANIGTTITGWILSIGAISGESLLLRLLKPSSFVPVIALVGIIFFMFLKKQKKKDTGMILLGFATLMFGMETMTSAMSGLSSLPGFRNAFTMFENPVLGILVGFVLTTLIQSSSASVGIVQALAITGALTYGEAFPVIMGTGIGSCTTALLSSVGAKKEAKRAAYAHLAFNIIGTVCGLILFYVLRYVANDLFISDASSVGIAIINTGFKLLCTFIIFPFTGLLENVLRKIIPDSETQEKTAELDDRLLVTPALALERCKDVMTEMADVSFRSLEKSLTVMNNYSYDLAREIRDAENETDHYEDTIGTFLIQLSTRQASTADSAISAEYLKLISDFERISDHSVNILEAAEEMLDKKLDFSPTAWQEYEILKGAVLEIMHLAKSAFVDTDLDKAFQVEPLEQVIDRLKEIMRTHHILRLQNGECKIETGFIWNDLLTNMERVSDHCSNIAGCVIDTEQNNMNVHATLRYVRTDGDHFQQLFEEYKKKYSLQR